MALRLDSDVKYIKGVGPRLGEILARRGIMTVKDLLEWYPRTYEDRRAARSVNSLEAGQLVSIKAQVLRVSSMNMGRSHRKIHEILIGDSTGRIACKFFRTPYRGYFERFSSGAMVRVAGKVTLYRGHREFHHPSLELADDNVDTEHQIVPVYTETEGLNPAKVRKIIETAFASLEPDPLTRKIVPDPLPEVLRKRYGLSDLESALREVHFPSLEVGEMLLSCKSPGQRRLIFDEFFFLELLLAQKKAGIERERGVALAEPSRRLEAFTRALPFTLTGAQVRTRDEIISDLRRPRPMHRLVQGDVGSGKTMVALSVAVVVADHGLQTALMVPTEILAEQHYQTAVRVLEPHGIRVALLTGQQKEKERKQVLEGLKTGAIDLCIGTHALIQDDVDFKHLGLAIIDEQHRFGVKQRGVFKRKSVSPHFLVMTATPIPRSLAMTVYGDLDVSVLDEMPKGRQPIVTRKTFSSKRTQVFQFMNEQIAKGRQAYVVYPLIEESEAMELKNAVDEFERLRSEWPDIRFALLHGKMKPQEKDQIMREFRAHRFDVLVSTTVIEVGVDVPNANIMIIEHAERFGLAQLHQLRGRVGRGSEKSYCVLMLGYACSDVARQRADIMEQTNDGFKIAEADLEMRGPGEFLGVRQSGLPGFKLANLIRDLDVLKIAREAAFQLIQTNPQMVGDGLTGLRQSLALHSQQIVG
jgi:ATP-dependent DNA helicase RecG